MYRIWMYTIFLSILYSTLNQGLSASTGEKTFFIKNSNSLWGKSESFLSHFALEENYIFIPLCSPLAKSGVYLGLVSSSNLGHATQNTSKYFKEIKHSIFSPRLGYKVGHYIPYVTVDLSENTLQSPHKKQASYSSGFPLSGVKGLSEEYIIPRLGLEKSFGRFKASIEYGFRRPHHLEDPGKSQGMSLNPSINKTLHSFKMRFIYGF
jgi:hypothetical protein